MKRSEIWGRYYQDTPTGETNFLETNTYREFPWLGTHEEKENTEGGEVLTKNFINVMCDIVREVSLKAVQVGFHLPEISVSFNERYDIAYVHLRVQSECEEAPYLTHYSEAFTLQEIAHLRVEDFYRVISQRFLYKMQRALNENRAKENRHELED